MANLIGSSPLTSPIQEDERLQGDSSPLTSPLSSPIQRHLHVPHTPRRTRPRSTSDCTQSTPRAHPHLPPPLAPLELSPGFVIPPPIRGTAEEQKSIRLKEGRAKRTETLAQRYAALEQQRLARAEEERVIHEETFRHCLELLRTRGVTFGEFIMYVFNPDSGLGSARWHDFAIIPGRVTQILDWWIGSRNPIGVRNEIDEWAVKHVCERLAKQARHVTREGKLKTFGRDIDEKLVSSFGFSELYQYLKEGGAELIVRVFEAITLTKDTPNFSNPRKERGKTIVTSTILQCLGEHNNANNLSRRMMGLYLYASGAQKQVIGVLSHLGITESYSNLVRNADQQSETVSETETPDSPAPSTVSSSAPSPTRATSGKSAFHTKPASSHKDLRGTLQKLCSSIREKARGVAATGVVGEAYDNINFLSRTGEQAVGHHDTQENGTCVTIFKLWAVKLKDLAVSALREAFDNAPTLTKEDILHTPAEAELFRRCLIHNVARIIVERSHVPKLEAFSSQASKSQPRSLHCITPHQTEIYPFGAYDIDESTITGNADVDEAVVTDLELRSRVHNFWDRIRIIAGDQLSLARLRSLQSVRFGHEGGYTGFGWGVWMPGLFHGKLADAQGIMGTHFGKVSPSIPDPGSLHFHNTRLSRLPITPTSLPPFSTCRNLIFVSLYARVLHCLLLVSGKSSLDDYADSIDSWEQLLGDAEKIYDTYVNASVVDELRSEREFADRNQSAGDMVFENAVLFLRDALVSREMADAIHTGDSGRIVLVLKIWALSFRGNGRTKYAYEMLHLIHNIEKVWPKPVRDAIFNNWLVSTNGISFLEVDLLQEHLNYWIKVFYKAHGSNMSWQWLGMITPCVNVLRGLSKRINGILGYDQGLRHAAINLKNDIHCLMDSLQERKVYTIVRGRKLNDDQAVPDVVSLGLQNLTAGSQNPLSDYNRNFLRLRRRSHMPPVAIGDASPPSHPATSRSLSPKVVTPESSHSSPVPPGNSSVENVRGSTDAEREDEDEDGEYSEDEEYILENGPLNAESQEPALGLYSAADVALEDEDEDWEGDGLEVDEGALEEVDEDPEAELEEPEADFFTL